MNQLTDPADALVGRLRLPESAQEPRGGGEGIGAGLPRVDGNGPLSDLAALAGPVRPRHHPARRPATTRTHVDGGGAAQAHRDRHHGGRRAHRPLTTSTRCPGGQDLVLRVEHERGVPGPSTNRKWARRARLDKTALATVQAGSVHVRIDLGTELINAALEAAELERVPQPSDGPDCAADGRAVQQEIIHARGFYGRWS